jgi:hypothetical protein
MRFLTGTVLLPLSILIQRKLAHRRGAWSRNFGAERCIPVYNPQQPRILGEMRCEDR